MNQLLARCGIRLPREQLEQLWKYHQLLRTANADLNLTRIHNFENMVLKHYVDSLIILKLTDLPSPLIDMGSGPGLPGIPLKIARQGVEMILAEPRGARADFLKHVCAELSLRDVEVHAGKINVQFTRRVSGVITRAVAPIAETLTRVSGCLGVGGRMIFMKGPECDAEIAEAAHAFPSEYAIVSDQAYDLPHSPHRRRLVIYERRHVSQVTPNDSPQPARVVQSATNPAFKQASELLTGRGIRKHGMALLAGTKIVPEVLNCFPTHVEAWITGTPGEPPPAQSAALPWLQLSESLFRELDVSGTHAPLLQVRVPEMHAWSDADAWPVGCTLFLPFQDPENVGAAIRSAAAFGVSRVVLLRESAHPFHPKSVRAAGPALFQVALQTGPSIHDLAVRDVPLFAMSRAGTPVGAARWPERFGLVVGLEGPGLPPELAGATSLSIPIAEDVESLNAAAATAVALYAWRSSMS